MRKYILNHCRVKFLYIVVTISLIKCILLFSVVEIFLTPNQQIGYFPDSYMYERIADNILSGHGFSLSESQPYKPTMSKEPLYPLFIALVKSISWGNINAVIFAQMILNLLIAILVYFIGKKIFNENIARFSSLIVALMPVYGELSFFIMPECLFVVLFLSTFLCFIKAVKSMNWIWYILSGLLLGVSALCRNAVLPLFLLYPIAVMFKNKKSIKAGLFFRLVIFVLSFSIVTMPWMIRNENKFGLLSISMRGGEILSHQAAWAANFSKEEWKAYSLYLISGSLAHKFYPHIVGNDFGNYEYDHLMRIPYVKELLQKHTEGDVEKILMLEGLQNIIHNPLKFLLLSVITYVQTFKYFESIALMLIKGAVGFEWIVSLSRFFLFIMGIAYTLLALQGVFYSRGLFETYLIVITIAYFHIALTPMGIIPGGLQRHILPITVFYSFFVVIAFDRISPKFKTG